MSEDIVENSIQDFAARLDALQAEAAKYGLSSLSVIIECSPFDPDERKFITHYGGHSAAIGMAENAKQHLFHLIDWS